MRTINKKTKENSDNTCGVKGMVTESILKKGKISELRFLTLSEQRFSRLSRLTRFFNLDNTGNLNKIPVLTKNRNIFKKNLILSVLLLFTMISANGQKFVGGSFGLDYGKNNDSESIFNLCFSPKFGYNLNDYLGLGVQLNYHHINVQYYEGIYKRLEVEPFFRFKILEFKTVDIFLETSVNFYDITDKPRFGSIGVAPLLSFGISERISFEANSNFFRLRYISPGYSDFLLLEVFYPQYFPLMNISIVFKF